MVVKMIKRVISFSLLIVILWFGFQMLINYLKTEHDVVYTLETFEDVYDIKESYRKISGKDYYYFEVDFNNFSFPFMSANYFNKQKGVVKDIKTYSVDDVFCLALIFIGENRSSVPLCSKDGKLYSYQSLKNDYDFTKFLETLPEFSSNLLVPSDTVSNYVDLSIYTENLYDNETFLIYNYKNMIRVRNNSSDLFSFSTVDNYKNELGTLVGKYYMIPEISSNPEYLRYLAYDVSGQVIKKIELPKSLSKQMYVNGVYDNKLYIFDKSNLTQYSINPYDNRVEIVGTTDRKGFNYQNGEISDISVYDLNSNDVLFSSNSDSYQGIEYDDIFVFHNYAIYVHDGNFYKVYENYLDSPIFLFTSKDAKEIIVNDNKIYYIKDDCLYRFDDYGNVILIRREEFKYNYENIYDVYVG